MTALYKRSRAALLVMPLVLFLALFFFWPLATMLVQAVSDPAAGRVLPRTVEAMSAWDGTGLPDLATQQAFAADLHDASDDLAVGDMVRRLNSAQTGFRSLMNKTLPAVRQDPMTDLAALDAKWSNPAYWLAIKGALSPITDRNLLATVDLERDSKGEIKRMPSGTSANGTIIVRTLVVSAMVTLCCLLIGLPYAMLAASVTGWNYP